MIHLGLESQGKVRENDFCKVHIKDDVYRRSTKWLVLSWRTTIPSIPLPSLPVPYPHPIHFIPFSSLCIVFTARRYGSAVYAVVMSTGMSVRLSQAGTVPKRLNVGSRKQLRIAQVFRFSDAKDLGEIPTGSPN